MAFSKEFKQELFDEGALAIIKQGKACMFGGVCAYSDGRGGHCIVGHLLANRGIISDEAFDRHVNGQGLVSFLPPQDGGYFDARDGQIEVLSWLEALGVDCIEDVRFLIDLQKAHDNMNHMLSNFKLGMRLVASRHGIDATVVA